MTEQFKHSTGLHTLLPKVVVEGHTVIEQTGLHLSRYLYFTYLWSLVNYVDPTSVLRIADLLFNHTPFPSKGKDAFLSNHGKGIATRQAMHFVL